MEQGTIKPQVMVLDDFAGGAAARFVETCTVAVQERRRAFVALAGGSTPEAIYRTVVERAAGSTALRDVEFYQGDERPVPPEHPDSNWGMAAGAMLDPLGVPTNRRHRMAAESADPDRAAAEYETLIRGRLPQHEGRPVFDLILLGLGEDGHTASLFPGTPALRETRRLVVANPVPKLQTTRLTFTWPLINAARQVWVLVSGGRKRDIVRRALVDRDESLPVLGVRPGEGRCVWLLDRAAAAGVERP